MANYFARVELHEAEWPDDYEELHESLAEVGFINCITFSEGSTKRLPTGFYFARNQSDDKSKVFGKVRQCADGTGYKNEVVVVKSGGSQSNLTKDCDDDDE